MTYRTLFRTPESVLKANGFVRWGEGWILSRDALIEQGIIPQGGGRHTYGVVATVAENAIDIVLEKVKHESRGKRYTVSVHYVLDQVAQDLHFHDKMAEGVAQ